MNPLFGYARGGVLKGTYFQARIIFQYTKKWWQQLIHVKNSVIPIIIYNSITLFLSFINKKL